MRDRCTVEAFMRNHPDTGYSTAAVGVYTEIGTASARVVLLTLQAEGRVDRFGGRFQGDQWWWRWHKNTEIDVQTR